MLPRAGQVRLGLVVAFLAAAGACSTYSGEPEVTDGGSDPGGGSGNATTAGTSAKGGTASGPGPINLGGFGEGGCDPESPTCGLDPGEEAFCSDSRHDPGEACDDGNTVSGDGCTATCAQVEGDFVCPTPGEPCVSTQKCGDKKVSSAETCDDGQAKPKDGDGCDASCQLEAGWVCPTPGAPCQAAKCGDGILVGNEQCEDGNATPTSNDGCSDTCQIEDGFICPTLGAACIATVCNDGKREGSEACDDGNQILGDGCTTLCQVEASCPKTGGACSSRCGDGLLLPDDAEECDDGNTVAGDGCSATCTVEDGYECPIVEGALPETLVLPFVFRDFVSLPVAANTQPRHPDFNGGCRGLEQEGMVADVLDADGKPTNSHLCDLPAAPTCTANTAYVGTGDMCARRDDCGGKAPTGCLGLTHGNNPLAAFPADDPFEFWYRDTAGVNQTRVTPLTLFKNAQGVYTYSAPAAGLYPIDDFGWVKDGAELAYNAHNYGFTTEVRYWFTFNGGETLTFVGDDDVWVFVNGRLALDMGGKHGAATRSVVLNADGSTTCATCATVTRQVGTVPGKVYEIALFHAERQTSASNFKLSLTGFVNKKSQCRTKCGDGIPTGDEECDDGDNNGDASYNGCTKQCKRGPYCGDGNVDAPNEACDDSVNISKYGGCAPGCKAGPYCGDGVVQAQEACDDGKFAGAYGGCAEGCVLGPRCGDKVVQEDSGEGCDDGNHKNLDGCSATCKIEQPK